MAFTIPTFNLSANFWRFGNPVTNPPDVSVASNLAWGRRVTAATGIPEDMSTDTLLGVLLLPKGTDVRDGVTPGGADTAEFPAGTGRYYIVKQVDDVGKGFDNEFRFAVVSKLAPWPAPIP